MGDNTLILCLDSNVVTPPTDQVPWINNMIAQANMQYKFTIYHAPMYPTYRTMDTTECKITRDGFLPTFDAQNITISFENHDHAYKRTKRLKGGVENPNGTSSFFYYN